MNGAIKLEQLNEASYNPRTITDEAFKLLCASIRNHTDALADWDPEDGFRLASTITVNRTGNRIVGGHQRKEKGLNIALNSPDAAGDWDSEGLKILLDELADVDGGLDLTALSEITITDFTFDGLVQRPVISEPGEVVKAGSVDLRCADCVEVMRSLPDDSVDACVTDPPYGIGFMGRGWDSDLPGPDFAVELFRVLKPGAHGVLFAANRTIHRMAVMLEDAEFEIRDLINWATWQGFPKSTSISKVIVDHLGAKRPVVETIKRRHGYSPGEGKYRDGTRDITTSATEQARAWDGWGTALKPVTEPCLLVRKPLAGNLAENVLKYGVGGINVDACRHREGDRAWLGPQDRLKEQPASRGPASQQNAYGKLDYNAGETWTPSPDGRWPSNLYHCPKVGKTDREEGMDGIGESKFNCASGPSGWKSKARKNTHPTVKPVELMRWLARLVTPPHGLVLEPFAGSGTTAIACIREGFQCLAIEREPEYFDIIKTKVAAELKAQESGENEQSRTSPQGGPEP